LFFLSEKNDKGLTVDLLEGKKLAQFRRRELASVVAVYLVGFWLRDLLLSAQV
jgi:hypothetical protein